MKRRNIHIIPSLGYGGAESFLLRLVPYLNHKNIIITLYKTNYDKERIKNSDFKYITLDPFQASLKDTFQFLKLLFSLNKNDTVYTWLYISDLIGSIIKVIFFWKDFKLIWNIRNTVISPNDYSIYAYISFSILRRYLKSLPNKIIFNSHRAMEEHINKGYPKAKSFVIYNGFKKLSKISNPKNDHNSFNIIHVARYHPQKNFDLVFESISKYKTFYNDDFCLNLVGKDINSDNSDLKTKLHALNIYENVVLHGLLEPKKVHKLFAKSDISLLLSRFGESFPNVLAESMLYGTFPIATNIGDSSFIVDKYGYIVRANADPMKIAAIINNYSLLKKNDYDKWKKEILSCQNFSKERFSIKKIAYSFNNLL